MTLELFTACGALVGGSSRSCSPSGSSPACSPCCCSTSPSRWPGAGPRPRPGPGRTRSRRRGPTRARSRGPIDEPAGPVVDARRSGPAMDRLLRLALSGPATGSTRARRACSARCAGVVSALLGIGGGIVKVPLMHLVMGVPLRVATATSNLMIGITASASAVIYLLRGGIDPYVAGPTAIGSSSARRVGSRVAHRVDLRVLRLLFVVVLALHGRPDAPAGAGPVNGARPARRTTLPSARAPPIGRLPDRRHLRLAVGPARCVGVVLMLAAGDRPARRRPAPSTSAALVARPRSPSARPGSCGWASSPSSRRPSAAWSSRWLVGFARRGERTMAIVVAPDPARDHRSSRGARPRPGGLTWTSSILAVAFVVILIGAELFTNGIEWFGRKLELAEGAVGSVLAAVGTALPETMIPIIAILFGGGEASQRGRRRRDPRRAVHALDAGDVRDRRRRPLSWRRRRADRDAHAGRHRRSSPTTCATSRSPTRSRSAPRSCRSSRAGSKWIVAVVLIGIYAWYVKGHFEADPDVDAEDLAPLRFHRLDRRATAHDPARAAPAGRQPPGPAALGCIVVGAFFFVDAVEHLADVARRRRGAARARHRPDRDRAAGEVQLGHLGPPGQGHAGDGQHHRRDGLPVDDPDGRRAALRVGRWHVTEELAGRVRVGRDRVPVVGRDLHPDVAPGPARRRALLVGGGSTSCTWARACWRSRGCCRSAEPPGSRPTPGARLGRPPRHPRRDLAARDQEPTDADPEAVRRRAPTGRARHAARRSTT